MYRIPYILTSLTDLKTQDWFHKLHYIYQHFQDSKKMYQLDPKADIPVPDNNSLYPYMNNDIEYGLFEDIVDSYYLDSQIKDDFHCNQDCYTQQQEPTIDDHSISCTHAYDHIVQQIQDLSEVPNNTLYIPWKRTHHYLLMIPQLHVSLISQIKTLTQTTQMI